MVLLSFEQLQRGVFCHNSAPYNRRRHLWGVWAYLCWMILFVSYPFICFRNWRFALASMLEMKFKPRTDSNPHQNTNYLAYVPEYQHFLGMVASERAKKDGDMSCPFLYTYFGYRLSNIFYGGMYQLLKRKANTSSTYARLICTLRSDLKGTL